MRRFFIFFCFSCCLTSSHLLSQYNPHTFWTFLPRTYMDEIIGESSGESAFNSVIELGSYNKDRLHEEYQSRFYETDYVYNTLKRYDIPGAEIVSFPGGRVWDGIKGELWEISPNRRKLASYHDMTAMLAQGSRNADVKAELVWIGQGTKEEVQAANVMGKIVVTEGHIRTAHQNACVDGEALGVIAISQSRPYFDSAQIPWSGITGWRDRGENAKFGFYLTFRDGYYLKQRLLRAEKIEVHAQVETTYEAYELQNIISHIPGTNPEAGEIYLAAHLFEGIVKQGANDNHSGSAAILETARILNTLIEEGRLPRPERTIRFLWGPEFSGTGAWVRANKEKMDNALCAINMDMVGEWLTLNKSLMCLVRTSYARSHYINDVMENYYRFVGETTREHLWGKRSDFPTPVRIVAPTGSDEPFYYSINVHSGSSDHEVFNDWAVGVPSIMMIAWPDQWYHTSGDRPDKADPTQLKRAAVIGAAAAYTIASADDQSAVRIAGEIAANGTRRLGHQFVLAQNKLNEADAGSFAEAFRMAEILIKEAEKNELRTLESVMELVHDKQEVSKYVAQMRKTIQQVARVHLDAIDTHMKHIALRLGVSPAGSSLSRLEREARGMTPEPTYRVKQHGYAAYRQFISGVSEEDREKFSYNPRGIGNMSELHRLINGSNSILDIKHALDAQYPAVSELESVMNYIKILELADLVTFK